MYGLHILNFRAEKCDVVLQIVSIFSSITEDKTRKMPKIKQVAEMTQVRIPSRLIKRNPLARLQVAS